MSDILNAQLLKRWETITCHSGGESCWCRGIILEGTSDRLDELDEDKNEINLVVGYAELPKLLAEHFVKLHNDYVDKLELEKDGGFKLEDFTYYKDDEDGTDAYILEGGEYEYGFNTEDGVNFWIIINRLWDGFYHKEAEWKLENVSINDCLESINEYITEEIKK